MKKEFKMERYITMKRLLIISFMLTSGLMQAAQNVPTVQLQQIQQQQEDGFGINFARGFVHGTILTGIGAALIAYGNAHVMNTMQAKRPSFVDQVTGCINIDETQFGNDIAAHAALIEGADGGAIQNMAQIASKATSFVSTVLEQIKDKARQIVAPTVSPLDVLPGAAVASGSIVAASQTLSLLNSKYLSYTLGLLTSSAAVAGTSYALFFKK
jgi:hypothetical protein